jgi:uncharacterized membrane protein
MFDFLFKYPVSVYRKGQFVFLSSWPAWILAALVIASALGLGWAMWRKQGFPPRRMAWLWVLQSALAAMLLLLLWRPALSVSTLKPQQNVIAVVIDDSRSMALADDGRPRLERALNLLRGGLLDRLKGRYPVRLYSTGEKLKRIDSLETVTAVEQSTRLGESLSAAMAESATLPIGAVVLLSDGADNSGGIDAETTARLRAYRIPVHAVGFGLERIPDDIEIGDIQMATRALPSTRVSALVPYRQAGFAGRKARIVVREGEKVLASREVKLPADGETANEAMVFDSGAAGVKTLRVSVEGIEQESNKRNNSELRVLQVESRKPRILYYEGEPRWEYKFLRRAAEGDGNLDLVTILRTTQNKIYRQGISSPKELEQGFPAEVDELFGFDGIIIGTVEAGSFTPSQLELLKRFVDRRGGGMLWLGGRASFSEGAWQRSSLAEILPVTLPDRKNTFRRDSAFVQLTPSGEASLICRIEETPERNEARWKTMPVVADYQDTGTPKPGAMVLAELVPTGSKARLPFLVTQSYGRGRVAVLASGGTWRWKMLQDAKDQSHEMFWRQMLRWLVAETPGRVTSESPRTVYNDEKEIPLKAEVRDRNYQPVTGAGVQGVVTGPGGRSETVTLSPDPLNAGVYAGRIRADATGSYLVEVQAKEGEKEAGRSLVPLLRQDGVAEDFHMQQNRELLERVAAETGGTYHASADAASIAEDIAMSDAGVSVRENRELWNMPAALLALLGLRAAEWLLRRRWGAV